MSTEERDETSATDTDEVEGHKATVRGGTVRENAMRATDDGDDVEGHGHRVRANDDAEGDDVEGHTTTRRPSVR
jgi:hypothetical protein